MKPDDVILMDSGIRRPRAVAEARHFDLASVAHPTEVDNKQRAAHWPPRGPVRLLIVLDRPTIEEMIKLTLNHGVYMTRTALTGAAAIAVLDEWQPHLVIFDADLNGQKVMQHAAANAVTGTRLPAIALTRRGDLRTKLAAFDWGVDDILTIPFAPEELLARVVALLRRSYSDAVTFTPVIHLGDLKIDILNRTVRVGTSELHLTSLEQSIATIPGRGYRFLPTFGADAAETLETASRPDR